jgi:twinkle protein
MGRFIRHEACPKCASSDALGIYEDGTGFCFSCSTYVHADGKQEDRTETVWAGEFTRGTFQDIPKRNLREVVCRRYGYQVGERNGLPIHIAPYRDATGGIVAQKIRFVGKEFSIEGNGKDMPLFGQHLWSNGRSVVITEGEIDCLSMATAMGDGKWPCVSLPNGAQSAEAAIKRAYDWLNGFEKIILCFDNDAPGKAAQDTCLPLLPPGKAYYMVLPDGLKDANEVLKAKGPAALSQAFWQSSQWRPDGIISGADITLESLTSAVAMGYALRLPVLNQKMSGLRKRELTLLTAGSGIGKSTLAREIAFGLHQDHGLVIGNVYLEESKEKTAQAYIAIDQDVPLGKLRAEPGCITKEQWAQSYEKVIKERMFFYDHFGSLESDRLISKLRYMAIVLKVDFIVLDHISIVISGQEGGSGDERKDIDRLMTSLRSLVEETGVGIIAIVHLKQPEGKPHEEGGRVTLSQLRGSGGLKQLSDNVIALERNQQGDNPDECEVRLLKNREFGDLGVADTLAYNRETGRLLPTEAGGAMGTLDV